MSEIGDGPAKDEAPDSIIFFPNGQTAVCNRNGNQIAKFQARHAESIKLLKEAGIDWKTIREKLGQPNYEH